MIAGDHVDGPIADRRPQCVRLLGRADWRRDAGEWAGRLHLRGGAWGAALGIQAQRQLMALDGFPAIGHGRTVSLRVAFGLSSRILTFQASDVTLPRGEQAILLSLANGAWATSSEEEIAALAIDGQHGGLRRVELQSVVHALDRARAVDEFCHTCLL